jgi:G3E family GTPase
VTISYIIWSDGNRSDFLTAVEALLKKRRFDYILLECSGLADPGALARMLWVDPELESKVYLDGIIGLVDCRHLAAHLADGQPESKQVLNQLAFADRILLNKTDLGTYRPPVYLTSVHCMLYVDSFVCYLYAVVIVSAAEVASLTDRVAELNSAAVLIPTLRSKVDLNQILDIKYYILCIRSTSSFIVTNMFYNNNRAFDTADVASVAVRKPGLAALTIENHKSSTSAITTTSTDTDSHIHDSSIRTVVLTVSNDRCVSLDLLKRWLGVTLWGDDGTSSMAIDDATLPMSEKQASARAAAKALRLAAPQTAMATVLAQVAAEAESKQQRIFRLKALMSVVDEPRQMFVQGVQELFDIQPGSVWPHDMERSTRMVVIGRHLNAEALQRGLESCCVPRTVS